MSNNLPPAKSITHEHLLSAVYTELSRRTDAVIRICDVGCGNGDLIVYLHVCLSFLLPERKFELYGLDVSDSGVQDNDYFQIMTQQMSSSIPGVDWSNRLSLINSNDRWPYQDNFFHLICSNQVIEHIRNHNHFFYELERTLLNGGVSIHLFPLRHYIWEGHLFIPFVHRIMNYDLLRFYIKFASRLGVGKYKAHQKSGCSLETFAERHADYMNCYTNYVSCSELLKIGKDAGLRVSFRYTWEFYARKIATIIGINYPNFYQTQRGLIRDYVFFHVAKYISSVTLFLEKKESYRSK